MQEQKGQAIVPVDANVIAMPTPPTLSQREEEERALVIASERRDESQIIAEMDGEILDEFYYEVKVKGVTKRKMLYAGIKEVARRMGDITVRQPVINETPDGNYYRILISARDEKTHYETWAAVEQSKFIKHQDGFLERDDFALAKLMAKAIRNVLRSIIPEAQMVKHINEWAEAKKALPAASPPPAAAPKKEPVSGARVAAMDTIDKFKDASEANRKMLWVMLSTKGYNLQNFPGWDQVPEEHLAFILREIQAFQEAQAKALKDDNKPFGVGEYELELIKDAVR